MLEEFGPERVRDCPISEAAISGAAAGAAMTGLRPIVDMTFMDFSVIAMDAIVNQAAKTRYMFGGKGQVPMTIRCARWEWSWICSSTLPIFGIMVYSYSWFESCCSWYASGYEGTSQVVYP